ncbi:unnamed protein product, partial [Scytosiphon promiscuus]
SHKSEAGDLTQGGRMRRNKAVAVLPKCYRPIKLSCRGGLNGGVKLAVLQKRRFNRPA